MNQLLIISFSVLVIIGFLPVIFAELSDLKVGDLFSYKICKIENDACKQMLIEIWVEEEITEELKYWIFQTSFIDKSGIINGKIKTIQSSLYPVYMTENLFKYGKLYKSIMMNLGSVNNQTTSKQIGNDLFEFQLIHFAKNVTSDPFMPVVTEYGANFVKETELKKYIEKPDTPKKQIISGILPENIVCNKELKLVFKSSNGNPACVKPETVEMLVKRGWAVS